MVDRESPEKINAHSWDALRRKAEYISDATHDNHAGKEVLPARNYNCPDQSLVTFLLRMNEFDRGYRDYRTGIQGDPIDRLWEEMVYSTLPGAYLTAEERDRIEQMIIARFGPNAIVRTAWHLSPDGRADLHVLMSATQPTKADPRKYEVLFGRRIKDRIAACIATDRKIARMLNANPHKHITHVATVDVKEADKEKPHPIDAQLAVEIAELHPNTSINQFNVGGILAALGHTVVELAKRSITLICKGTVEQVTRPLHKLFQEIRAAQKRKKPKPLAEQIAEKWPDTRINQNNLPAILAACGHQVVETTTHSLTIKKSTPQSNQGDPEATAGWSLRKLQKDILKAQVRHKREKYLKQREAAEFALAEKNQTTPQIDEPATEAPLPPMEPQTPPPQPTTTKPTPAEKTARKVAELTEFIEDFLGRIKVDPKRRTTLYRASQRMIDLTGTLRPEFAKTLTPEQKADLTSLAAEYAKRIQ